jgi:hypothetical protein
MTTHQLYFTLTKQIELILGQERVTRKRVLAWVMTCLCLGRTPLTNRLANKMPGKAKKLSKAKRIRRWLNNPAIRVRLWYEPIARALLQQAVAHGLEIRLIVDGSRVGSRHQLLMVSLACRRRSLPIAWTWVRQRRGHSSARKQIALLAYVRSLLPEAATVLLVGDSEFGSIPVIRALEKWDWLYVLRQKGKNLTCLEGAAAWIRFDRRVTRGGPRFWATKALLTQSHTYTVSLVAIWPAYEKTPWLLATNLPSAQLALRAYSRRMWIEAMFADFKSNGFDIERTRLHHFLRLSRLVMAIAMLYVWLVAFGSATIKSGRRHLVDRSDRRDLSIFRIGYDMLERCLVNQSPIFLRMIPYF